MTIVPIFVKLGQEGSLRIHTEVARDHHDVQLDGAQDSENEYDHPRDRHDQLQTSLHVAHLQDDVDDDEGNDAGITGEQYTGLVTLTLFKTNKTDHGKKED